MEFRPVVHPQVPTWAAAGLTGRGWRGLAARTGSSGTAWTRPLVGALGIVGGLGVVKGLVVAPAVAAVGGGLLLLAPGAVLGGAYLASRGTLRSARRRYGDQVFTADQLTRAAVDDPEFGTPLRRLQRAATELRATRAWRDGWLPVGEEQLAAIEWRATELAWRLHRIRRALPDTSPLVAAELRDELAAGESQLTSTVADFEESAALGARIDRLAPLAGSLPSRYDDGDADEPHGYVPGALTASLTDVADLLDAPGTRAARRELR